MRYISSLAVLLGLFTACLSVTNKPPTEKSIVKPQLVLDRLPFTVLGVPKKDQIFQLTQEQKKRFLDYYHQKKISMFENTSASIVILRIYSRSFITGAKPTQPRRHYRSIQATVCRWRLLPPPCPSWSELTCRINGCIQPKYTSDITTS